MPANQPLPPWMFDLEGTFLGFLGKHPSKPKSAVLEVDGEQMTVKLPKELRHSVQRQRFVPGDRVRCIGRSQIDFDARVIKLKAFYFLPLSPKKDNRPLHLVPSEPNISSLKMSSPAEQCMSKAKGCATGLGQKRAKILVCRKSGCRKRGGHRLVAELERILKAQQLQDRVEIQYTGCQKRCSRAPSLTVMPGKHHYDRLNLNNLPALLEEQFCTPQ
ncbi:MAG: (2Fe-2S) ferredoxin domain-containing protein [Cyanobacteria bacterium P01_E01_bin.34]